ncbi:MAG: flagellin [Pseudomonadota bacterium]
MAVTPKSYTSYLAPRDITADSRRLVDRLSDEMGSGRRSDVGRSVASDFSVVSRLAHELDTFDARKAGLAQAKTWASAAQGALSTGQDALSRLAQALPATFTPTGLSDLDVISLSGRNGLEDMINALNITIDGRAVFGNGALDAPLADIATLLSDIEAIAAASPDLASYEAGLDGYFAVGGGFETNVLALTKTTAASFPDGEGNKIEFPLSADDREVRGALRQAAFFAALPSAGFSAQEILTSQRGAEIVAETQGAISGLIELQASVGSIEERVETKITRLSDARLDVETELARLTRVDEYETASHLQNEFSRLESLYAITARRTRLNLTSFLR